MSAHLLNVSIGPVQEFIAAARRTRDLWFGSFLLSEVSKAAAAELVQSGGKLIFPPADTDLSPGNEAVNVANVILAQIDDPDAALATRLKAAAAARWKEFTAPVLERLERQDVLRPDVWGRQVEDVIEFYAAWTPLGGGSHQDARRRLARLVAGRKSCRNFLPGSGADGKLPKSSLDGLRETVFRESSRDGWPPWLRVRKGEHLDVIGLVKRVGRKTDEWKDKHRAYPSVSRVAADPWLRGVDASPGGPEALDGLSEACRGLRDDEILHQIDTTTGRLHDGYRRFRFEGSVVYRSRHAEIIDEGRSDEEKAFRRRRLAEVGPALAAVEAVAGRAGLGRQPDPYVAFLIADGDRVGAAISGIEHEGRLEAFSKALAQFAVRAAGIVKDHRGVTIYAGGDDVVAFLPVDQALGCARRLHDDFGAAMAAFAGDVEAIPTLSVGVAVGHYLEDLEELRRYAKEAEDRAKGADRDGLAVHLHKRGGVPVRVRSRWADGADPLDARLERYARWFLAGAVSNRTPYELHRLADVYDGWPDGSATRALEKDAVRVIQRKRPGGEATAQMGEIRDAVAGRDSASLRELARELLVARQVAEALKQRGER